ncbi:amidohydrolase family protein [Roseiarcaceae bacterium H3SJ34-1]|uniref:amidohydrolase family protein n=1 Tax=Terripilifer ovatus TaxID=3032367 RepID=UPI003AB93E69|nr:amidohydrolase family protein [Roseiarcaceae bacterium H3SJ34-1]
MPDLQNTGEGQKADIASRLPAGSCDCQIHVYDDPARYPIRHAKPSYEAPAAPLSAALAMHRRVGLERVVIVQATVYRTDHSLLLASLAKLPAQQARGIAIIDDTVSDADLERLDAGGVRGARFNFQQRLGVVPSIESFRRSVARVKELGWFIKIFAGPGELVELESELDRCDLPVVLDHMGQLNGGSGIDAAGLRRICAMLQRDDRWIMLSNGHRISATGYPWDDAVPVGQAYYRTAPDRCIWGSDWPHIGSRGGPMPDDADLLKLLLRYLPDAHAVENVLVGNPQRLFGFEPAPARA